MKGNRRREGGAGRGHAGRRTARRRDARRLGCRPRWPRHDGRVAILLGAGRRARGGPRGDSRHDGVRPRRARPPVVPSTVSLTTAPVPSTTVADASPPAPGPAAARAVGLPAGARPVARVGPATVPVPAHVRRRNALPGRRLDGLGHPVEGTVGLVAKVLPGGTPSSSTSGDPHRIRSRGPPAHRVPYGSRVPPAHRSNWCRSPTARRC